ncbi:MAG: hypothetical protein ACTHJK_04695 [Sphingomicrobium sp.]
MGVKQPRWIGVDGRSRRWRWARLHLGVARAIFFRGNPREAILNLHLLRDEFGESDFCAAYEGRLLLKAGDPQAARKAYADVFQAMRDRIDNNGRFIRYVAEGWLAVVDGKNPSLAERCFTRASEIPIDRDLRAANPGSVFNRPDKFDQEFEKWMRRNYPGD